MAVVLRELDEKVERPDLDSYETSKARLAEIQQAVAQARAEKQVSAQAAPKPSSKGVPKSLAPDAMSPRERGSVGATSSASRSTSP